MHSKKIVLILIVLWALCFLHLYHRAGLSSRIKYKLRGHVIFNPPIQEETLRTRVPKHEQASKDDIDLVQNERQSNIQALGTDTRSDKANYDRKKSLIDERNHSPRNIDKGTNRKNVTAHSNVYYRHSNATMNTYKDIVFPEPDCDRKFLIYVCSTGDKCGGLADRQKGMMSAFLLALMTGRTLLILADYPCDITQYVRPNVYDWTKCWTDVHKYVNHSQREIKTYMLGFSKFTFPKDLARYHGDDLWGEHVVKVHMNTRLLQMMKSNRMVPKKMPWIDQIPEERIIKNVMEILFRNSEKLQNQISNFLRRHVQDRPLVCGHIRVGQNPSIIGRYRDPVFMNITNAITLLKSIREIHRSTPGSALFLSSDSNEVKLKAKAMIQNMTLFDGHIEHIDKIRSVTCSGMNTACVEQQILSKCHTLILTGSGFSKMAAFMGGKATHIYTTETRESTAFKEVPLRNFTHMFGPFD